MITRRELVGGTLFAAIPESSIAGPDIDAPLDELLNGRHAAMLKLALSEPGSNEVRRDDIAQAAAFLGLERTALKALESRFPLGAEPPPGLLPALPILVEEARKTRIVILNEWHHGSRHRWFMGLLAARLRPHGFRYLAAETFSPMISAFSKGGGVDPMMGIYLNDPRFANAIKDARRLGYEFLDYEAQDVGALQRDEQQAANLIDKLSGLESSAKILVHVGLGHGAERDRSATFARVLKERTGIDPLTIAQQFTSGRYYSRFPEGAVESPTPNETAPADFTVHHFLTPDRAGRPPWIGRGLRRVARPRDCDGVLVVCAYAQVEAATAVPVDIAVMHARQDHAYILAPATARLTFERVD